MALDNPFTRYLRSRLQGGERVPSVSGGLRSAEELIRMWDDVETLVIQVYRSEAATARDKADWRAIRQRFDAVYGPLEDALAPHWAAALVGGQPVAEDPFKVLLRHESAVDFVGSWDAMRLLPAAREALNRWLVELGALERGSRP